VTLAVSAGLAFMFTLLLYTSLSNNSLLSRLPYGLFVSVLPAVGALVVLKLTKLSVPWRGAVLSTWATAALIYFLLFLLVFISTLVRGNNPST